MPRAYDPRADLMDGTEVVAQLARIRERIQDALMTMPSHEYFLQQYCPARPPTATSGVRP